MAQAGDSFVIVTAGTLVGQFNFLSVPDLQDWQIDHNPVSGTITAKVCPCPEPCAGDLDNDGIVGISDLLALPAEWVPNPGHPADLNGDDVVGINDPPTARHLGALPIMNESS